jgi:hypothetical protein
MYLHIMLYDHFKNIFIHVTYPDYEDRLESLETLRKRAEEAKGGIIARLLPKLYYKFYRMETAIVSMGYLPGFVPPINELYPDPAKIDPYVREIYYSEMRPAVRMWSFIGDTTHLSLFILFAVMDKMILLFPTSILLMNLYMIIVIVYQRNKFRQLGLEHQFVSQEKYD